MTEFDYVVLAILGCSAILGFIRGFLKEAFSLIAYVAAAYAAVQWGPSALPWFQSLFDNYYVSAAVSYAVVFIATLLVVGLINLTLSSMISYAGLGPADSGLGLLFGLVRGLIIVLAVVILLGYTDFPQQPWWQNAAFSAMAVDGVNQLKSLLSADIAQYLPY
ncbi:MAG: CvpA family protein [Pelistega sp.]|nr:CvpA family protein [Pelistega sp.]